MGRDDQGMVILICGDRNWKDGKLIRNTLRPFAELGDLTVVHGGCRGADSIANQVAIELNANVICCQADWVRYGKAAGPIRNEEMLCLKPDLVIAFHDNIEESKGTKDCFCRAKEKGIKAIIVSHG